MRSGDAQHHDDYCQKLTGFTGVHDDGCRPVLPPPPEPDFGGPADEGALNHRLGSGHFFELQSQIQTGGMQARILLPLQVTPRSRLYDPVDSLAQRLTALTPSEVVLPGLAKSLSRKRQGPPGPPPRLRT